jgi:uncharacterized protein
MKKFLSSYPELVKEWHPTKNGDLTPNDFTHGSGKKVWWVCHEGHDYESSISHRTNKKNQTGCPYCSGRYPTKENNLLVLFPDVAKEWHPTKNLDLTPKDFLSKSNKRVWWLCPKEHEYESFINNRTKKYLPRGCPYCSGRYPTKENNLLVLFPDVAKEWHPTKNLDLTPEDFTSKSASKVWWLCLKGHTYESSISHRTCKNPTGCPFCSSKYPTEENNLLVLFPDVAKEWHPTKNGDLTPKDFLSKSNKNVWWLCPNDHEYKSVISNRTSKKSRGCPYCYGRYPTKENNLLVLFPDVAKEWHPTKNLDLTPEDFTSKSASKVWWLCLKCHTYESSISHRTGKKPTGCPYCSGRYPTKENNLLVLFPDVAKEWHPTKNGDLTPDIFTSKNGNKVWWMCPKGHSYESVISSRTGKNQTGCPRCSNQSSEPEIRILSELKWFFDEINSRYKIEGVEIDIFLPSYNLGIEYDGHYFHKDKEDSDLRKNKFLLAQNINLMRVREHPLQSLSGHDVVCKRSLEKTDLNEILKKIYPFVEDKIKEKINNYVVKPSFINQELFQEYRSYFPSPFPEHSLLTTHHLVSDEWDYEKNYPLIPDNFSYGSKNMVWWLCPKGHSYESVIGRRTGKKPTGCPYCSGRYPTKENNLLVLFPDVAKEWHPTKNGDLIPDIFTSKNGNKVWWMCPKGHSYESVIRSRTGKNQTGCPYCYGRYPTKENNLLVLFPETAEEWHPTKNDDFIPKDFTSKSHKKVWWLCPEGHSYESQIYNRTNKKNPSGCPYCSGRFPTKENNLLVLFPKVSKEWHPTKNGDLVPEDFTGRSNKKVWWECPRGHEYESIISNRTKSDKPTGCSSCSGNKPSKENNLLVLFPQVAKEWHPIKNGKLTPEDFTYGSGKEVWWKCKKGHEWEARIHKRTRKEKSTGCPFCSGRKKTGELVK